MLKTSNRVRGFTLVELLVVIAIISVIAGFLIPTLMKARGKADEVKCQSNLRELQRLGMIFADSGGNRFYPLAKGTAPAAHESLNMLIKSNEGLKPKLFLCPTFREDPAETDADGRFTLDENTCSYTWSKKRLSPSDPPNTPLSCDKEVRGKDQANGHPEGRNVVFLDGSVELMKVEPGQEAELPRGLTR
jgi:prepilin-type N-terminal cleavage/methylation domain-containing protein/prepilin-type processing-associated H-X9-DG protein